jgi:predicted small secreted protein
MRRMLLAICLVAAPLAAAGCNTVEGLGEDISQAGDALENAAERAKD